MANSDNRIPNLGEGVTLYLATLSAEKREVCQPEIFKFAHWYGWESSFSKLAAPAVAGYAEQLSVSDTDYTRKLELIRAFFAYAKKVGWSQTNLGTHLKTKKVKAQSAATSRGQAEGASLTQQRYDELVEEMNNLKQRSQELVFEIQRAAADKDFRENAPLAAAREERGFVEGRIKELNETLKSATIIEEKKAYIKKSVVGDTIVLHDLAAGEELRYMIVDPREVDPVRGKISIASPLGKALLGRRDGEEIEVKAPAGKLRFRIEKIER